MNFLFLPDHWTNCICSSFHLTCLVLLMFSKQKESLSFFYLHSLNQISSPTFNFLFFWLKNKKGEGKWWDGGASCRKPTTEGTGGGGPIGGSRGLDPWPGKQPGFSWIPYADKRHHYELLCPLPSSLVHNHSPNSIHAAPLLLPIAVYSSPFPPHSLPQLSSSPRSAGLLQQLPKGRSLSPATITAPGLCFQWDSDHPSSTTQFLE